MHMQKNDKVSHDLSLVILNYTWISFLEIHVKEIFMTFYVSEVVY